MEPAAAGHADRAADLRPAPCITWICVVIFVVVFGVMFYSIFAHRKSKGHQAAQFHENTTVEIIWTVVPFLILLLMAFPATKTMLAMKDTSAPDITIKVTGFQWKWDTTICRTASASSAISPRRARRSTTAEPKGEHYLLEVDKPLVVPVGKKVRVLITAGDVIHSWWVPAFGVKQDAIPGFVRDAWFKADKRRHLPRPVRRAVRQGARLHADRRRGEVAGGIRDSGSPSRRRRPPRRPRIRTRSGT